MRLLLIRSFFDLKKFYRRINESLALEYLASFLLQNSKHQVQILDAIAEGWNKQWFLENNPVIYRGLKARDIIARIKDYRPEVIGLTWPFSTQNQCVSRLAQLIKEHFPNIILISGGPHVSSGPREVLEQNKSIDIVVCGEGELTLKELLDKNCCRLETIEGIGFREQGRIKINPRRALIKDINQLFLPARSLTAYENYSKQELYHFFYHRFQKIIQKPEWLLSLTMLCSRLPFLDKLYFYLYSHKRQSIGLPFADIMTSRGCPNQCSFCAIRHTWGRSWRPRSADNVLEEIDSLVSNYGVRHINVQDENFTLSKQRTIEICKAVVKRGYQLSFWANVYPMGLDREVLFWLKKAGFHRLWFSIESGNQRVLNEIIKKRIDLSKVKGLVDICRDLGIFTEGLFMFGLPGETIQEMQDTLNFSKSMGFDNVKRFIFQPFPHTELYDICVKNDYLTKDYDPNQLYINNNKCFVKTREFSPSDVLRIVNS